MASTSECDIRRTSRCNSSDESEGCYYDHLTSSSYEAASGLWDWISTTFSASYSSDGDEVNDQVNSAPNIKRNSSDSSEDFVPAPTRQNRSKRHTRRSTAPALRRDYVQLHTKLIELLLNDKKEKDQNQGSCEHRSQRHKKGKSQSTIVNEIKHSSGAADIAGFLSRDCHLQKDKGKGVEPGTAVCALGREAALGKLRDKVEVLTRATGNTLFSFDSFDEGSVATSVSKGSRYTTSGGSVHGKGKGPTVIKRPAKLTKLSPPETRSILEVRMGYLSMKYGILLQWNDDTGLVDLIVMRKMVSRSFMKVECERGFTGQSIHNRSSEDNSFDRKPISDNLKNAKGKLSASCIYLLRDNEDLAILSSTEEDDLSSSCAPNTEVAYLDPPYLVPRPDTFPSSLLSILVLDIRGLQLHPVILNRKRPRFRKKNKPTYTYARISLRKNKACTKKQAISTYISWGVDDIDVKQAPDASICQLHLDGEHDTHLKIEILHFRGKFRRDRVLGELLLPLNLVEAHFEKNVRNKKYIWNGTDSYQPATMELTLPFKIVSKKCTKSKEQHHSAYVTLSFEYENRYRQWLKQELEARRRQDGGFFDWILFSAS